MLSQRRLGPNPGIGSDSFPFTPLADITRSGATGPAGSTWGPVPAGRDAAGLPGPLPYVGTVLRPVNDSCGLEVRGDLVQRITYAVVATDPWGKENTVEKWL